MSQKEVLLAAFDDTLSYPEESLEYILRDLTEEEARYQHLSYDSEPPEENYPPAGTALWHLVHLAHCYKHYVNKIEYRPNQPPDILAPAADSLLEAIQNLRTHRARLRETFAALPESAFDEPIANYPSIAAFMRMVTRHDAWHSGQIAVVRRLFRTRNS
jgi:hypothetical protein